MNNDKDSSANTQGALSPSSSMDKTLSDPPPKTGAVDTGRRIDPAKLQMPKAKTRIRKRPATHKTAEPIAGSPSPAKKSPEQKANTQKQNDSASPSRPVRKRKSIRVVEKKDLIESSDTKRQRPKTPLATMPPSQSPPPDEENISFADLLADQGAVKTDRINVGDKIEAQIIHIGKESAFLAINQSQEGSLPKAELLDENRELVHQVGDTLSVYVLSLKNGIHLSQHLNPDHMNDLLWEEAQKSGIPVTGLVSACNKGGLEISLSGRRAFCPMGQVDLDYIEDPESFVGQTLEFIVREIKEGGRDIVLSRRALLQKERNEKAAVLKAELKVGDARQGRVSKIMPFGVFVDLGGMDGLVPLRELAHYHVTDPNDVVSEGAEVAVKILSIEEKEPNDKSRGEELRIGLSLRAAKQNPWETHRNDLVVGQTVPGFVSHIESFGAFVDLFAKSSGVTGLLHISEISNQRIQSVSDVLSVHEEVHVRIVDVDFSEQKIALRLRESNATEDDFEAANATASSPHRLTRGSPVVGKVSRVERYGVFLTLDDGKTAFMHSSETGTPSGSDLRKNFQIDSIVDALVIDIDDRQRIKVSRIAHEAFEEQQLVREHQKKSKPTESLGTFADLFAKKLDK